MTNKTAVQQVVEAEHLCQCGGSRGATYPWARQECGCCQEPKDPCECYLLGLVPAEGNCAPCGSLGYVSAVTLEKALQEIVDSGYEPRLRGKSGGFKEVVLSFGGRTNPWGDAGEGPTWEEAACDALLLIDGRE